MNTTHPKILRALLVSLHQCSGVPMPEAALLSAAQTLCRPAEPTDGDVLDALKDLQSRRLVDGVSDDLMGTRVWVLTPEGTLKARQLK